LFFKNAIFQEKKAQQWNWNIPGENKKGVEIQNQQNASQMQKTNTWETQQLKTPQTPDFPLSFPSYKNIGYDHNSSAMKANAMLKPPHF